MQTIKIGGVPEHFNLPIHLAIEQGWFNDMGLSLEWIDYPGGSGFMKEALRKGELDVCILLTEGIVADILHGNPSKIISGFVKTSLTWGIHTKIGKEIPLKSIFDKKIAISRFGSGSHLMPIVHAMMEDTSIEKQQFVEIGNIAGGITSLQKEESEIFYWEKFTTKPFLEEGQLRRIGEFISPWPCFMIAATNDFIERDQESLIKALQIIHRSNEEFMKNPNAPAMVSEKYNLNLRDAERWYHSTEWSTNGWVSNKMLEGVLFSLKEAKIISQDATPNALIWERNKRK